MPRSDAHVCSRVTTAYLFFLYSWEVLTISTSIMSLPLKMVPDLSEIPALAPPAGVMPNFVDPYSRGPLFVALSAVAIAFMYLFITARFYSKLLIYCKATWDDRE
jgi:hypothetical protein